MMIRLGGLIRLTFFAAPLAALLGCDTLIQSPDAVDAPSEPEPQVTPAKPPEQPSTESQALTRYYTRLQNDLLTQGLLRGDGGGPDTTFTDTQLARNFVRIALFNEYQDDSDFLRPQATVSDLRRWDQPIRMTVQFGGVIPEAQRDQDVATVSAYAARLSRLTGVPITLTDRAPNFHVLFLDEAARRDFGPSLRRLIPNISAATARSFTNLSRDQLCVVIGVFKPGASEYSTAVAMIRAEHPSLMRSACIHEELAQGMGLANDSPSARPSIFNDDEEFALLTHHDELLLKMLYDTRFETGMAPSVAAPIARQIAREYLDGGRS